MVWMHSALDPMPEDAEGNARLGLSDLSLRFLGSGDAFGSGGRFQACILLSVEGHRVLLDCGASSLIAMKRFGVDPNEIEAILLSHLHGDHFGGVPFFLLDAQFHMRKRALTVAGPPGVESRVRDAMEVLFPGSTDMRWRFSIDFTTLVERRRATVGPVDVTAFRVLHTPGCSASGLRLCFGDKTVAYSGDTEWTSELLELAAGADLFVCEAYSFEKKIRYHLDYRTLMKERPALTCKRLVLTHMGADLLARLPQLSLEVAEDGRSLSI